MFDIEGGLYAPAINHFLSLIYTSWHRVLWSLRCVYQLFLWSLRHVYQLSPCIRMLLLVQCKFIENVKWSDKILVPLHGILRYDCCCYPFLTYTCKSNICVLGSLTTAFKLFKNLYDNYRCLWKRFLILLFNEVLL